MIILLFYHWFLLFLFTQGIKEVKVINQVNVMEGGSLVFRLYISRLIGQSSTIWYHKNLKKNLGSFDKNWDTLWCSHLPEETLYVQVSLLQSSTKIMASMMILFSFCCVEAGLLFLFLFHLKNAEFYISKDKFAVNLYNGLFRIFEHYYKLSIMWLCWILIRKIESFLNKRTLPVGHTTLSHLWFNNRLLPL